MYYQRMWENLKERIDRLKESYIGGDMMSMAESFEGEKNCEEFLKIMNEIESEEKKKKGHD